MRSSTLFVLLTVFLFALTISISAYPEDTEKTEGKEEGDKKEVEEKKEGEEGEDKKEGEGEKKEEKNSAMVLFSSNSLSAIISLVVASVLLSIH